MLYEIDFFPVGDGEKSGDAISFRYSYDGKYWTTGIIDGGTEASGQAMLDHISKYYETNIIDYVICTHPDQDHASGLSIILDNIHVSNLFMHCPWNRINQIYRFITDGRVTRESLRQRLIEGHPYAYNLYEKAESKNIHIYEPFSDNKLLTPFSTHLKIIGPSEEYYIECLRNFKSIQEITETILEKILRSPLKGKEQIIELVNWVKETWNHETLLEPTEDAVTSENNSSVISLLTLDHDKILFTSDSGVPALNNAIEYSNSNGISLDNISLFQAPHHGSRRNLGPSVLDKLLGKIRKENNIPEYTAIISATKEPNLNHPSKKVVNALIRRGAKVIATQGETICRRSNEMQPRKGWYTAKPLSFNNQVEDT